jgi:hypothetical protein
MLRAAKKRVNAAALLLVANHDLVGHDEPGAFALAENEDDPPVDLLARVVRG